MTAVGAEIVIVTETETVTETDTEIGIGEKDGALVVQIAIVAAAPLKIRRLLESPRSRRRPPRKSRLIDDRKKLRI